jgi:hypothetical protein
MTTSPHSSRHLGQRRLLLTGKGLEHPPREIGDRDRQRELQARALFEERYGVAPPPLARQIERRVIGGDWGANGYTTIAQADTLADKLGLSATDRLLDIGAGRGWPGLYLAATTGCRVVVTDLPLEGLRGAADRAAARALPPARPWSWRPPAGCSSGPAASTPSSTATCCADWAKLSGLRACRRLLRRGGRMAFTTILEAPGLDPAARRQARAAGPRAVAMRSDHRRLLGSAGFRDITEVDVTPEFRTTAAAWLTEAAVNAKELARLEAPSAFAQRQADRRAMLAAINAGLLLRSLVLARRP